MLDLFGEYDKECDGFEEFYRNCCPDRVENVTPMGGLSESQIRFLVHFKDSQRKKKTDWKKTMEGARKHGIWGFYFNVADSLCATRKEVITEIIGHIDEVPEQYRLPFIVSISEKTHYSNWQLNDIVMELIGKQENRIISEKLPENEFITVYRPALYNESAEDAFGKMRWYVNVKDAVEEMFMSFFPEYQGKVCAETVLTKIMTARIHRNDILIEYDVGAADEHGIPVILQNEAVSDIHEEIYEDEELEWFRSNMDIQTLDDEDMQDELDDWKYGVFFEAGIPNRVPALSLINLSLSKPDEIRNLIRNYDRFTDGDAMKIARRIIKENPDNRWVMKFGNINMKPGCYYKALWYSQWSRTFFSAYVHIKRDGDLEGPYGTDLKGGEDTVKVVAFDPNTQARTLAEAQNKTGVNEKKQVSEVRKTEKTEQKPEKITLNDEDVRNLKKDMYISQLEQMYENELEKKSAELERLKEVIQQMQVEMNSLERKNTVINQKLSDQETISILKAGKEPEKFDNEAKAFVMKAIRHEVEHSDVGTRRHDVLQDIYEANCDGSERLLSGKYEEVRRIVKGYRQATDIKADLIAMGFEMTQDGPHMKIRYPKDSRYSQTIAGSASDSRAGDNLAVQMRKKFF